MSAEPKQTLQIDGQVKPSPVQPLKQARNGSDPQWIDASAAPAIDDQLVEIGVTLEDALKSPVHHPCKMACGPSFS